jgi:hypothetical protein
MNKAIKKLTLIHFSSVFLIKYVLPYGMGSKNWTLEISFAYDSGVLRNFRLLIINILPFLRVSTTSNLWKCSLDVR